jgi:hypothetical protein
MTAAAFADDDAPEAVTHKVIDNLNDDIAPDFE